MLCSFTQLQNFQTIHRSIMFDWQRVSEMHSTLLASRTVGEVRETSDQTLLSMQDLGKTSVSNLRQTLGPPSCDGVRPFCKKPV
jgi:hypothetical protein